MRQHFWSFAVAGCLLLGAASCEARDQTPASRPTQKALTKKEAIEIARVAAKTKGVRLSDYREPTARRDPDGTWVLTFLYKEDMPGGWFSAIIDPKTRQVEILPGL
jgi:hypothetical protein